jgi:hypothetical protein
VAGIDTLNLDPEQIFKSLGSFWDRYAQRDILGKFWEGAAQIIDNEYLQLFQANFSKSVLDVPLEWHYQWILFDLVKEPEAVVVHDHLFLELTATGGETKISLTGATTPVKITVFLNTVFLSDESIGAGTNWRFLSATNEVEFFSALTAGDEVFITWVEEGDSFDRRHDNFVFEEFLTASKSSWDNSPGDPFDPLGNGSYDSGSTTDPIEVFVNGLKQPSSTYTETSDTKLDTSFTLVAGDHILFRWRRANTSAPIHTHLRFTKVIATPSDRVNLPFGITINPRAEFVYINGIMQFRGVGNDYVAFEDKIVFDAVLDVGDVFELEFYGDAFLFQYAIDPDIIRIPVLQNGIDEKSPNPPTICLREGIDYEIVEDISGNKFISANTDIEGELWAPDIFVNERTVQKNFGEPLDFIRDNDILYKRATQSLWKAFWRGPDVKVIEDTLKALFGLPIAPTGGTVRSVKTVGGKTTVILLEGDEFEIPDGFKVIVTEGQVLEILEPLTDGVQVLDVITDPNWGLEIGNLSVLLDEKFIVEDAMPGFFDELNDFYDDGGSFDELDDGPLINQKLFDALKTFTFAVVFNPLVTNAVALGIATETDFVKQAAIFQDARNFLDAIKPAYTQCILTANFPIEDTFPDFTDDFSFLLDFFPTDSLCTYDDGGFFDASGPLNSFVATAGQTVFNLNPAFPYVVGAGDLKVFVNQVLQTITVDYLETNGVTVTFVVGLVGGEEVIIYEDNATLVPFDHRCMRDEVSLVLA